MADYNQQNQRVDRQYNAGRDVNAQRYTNYDQHIQYQESVGRDKIQVSHVHHNTTPASSVLARGAIIVVVLLLLGAGVFFAYPSLKGFANRLFSAGSSISNTGSGISNSQNGLNSMIYGTPKGSLDEFCHLLQSGDVQGAYDDYSDHLKSQISPSDFTNAWHQPGESVTECVDSVINTSGTSATGTLNITAETIASTGVTNNSVAYNVTMVSDDGLWKIDTLAQQ